MPAPPFIALYSDGLPDSQEAERLLREHGFVPEVVKNPREDLEFPLVIFRAWRYVGLPRIQAMLREFEFQSRVPRG